MKFISTFFTFTVVTQLFCHLAMADCQSIFDEINRQAAPEREHQFEEVGKSRLLDAIKKSAVTVNCQNAQGVTPLHLALVVGLPPSAIKLLIDNGADVNAEFRGMRPFDLTLKPNFPHRVEITSLLLRKGAKTARDQTERAFSKMIHKDNGQDDLRAFVNKGYKASGSGSEIDLALQSGSDLMWDRLLKTNSRDRALLDGSTTLFAEALKAKRTSIAKRLLSAGELVPHKSLPFAVIEADWSDFNFSNTDLEQVLNRVISPENVNTKAGNGTTLLQVAIRKSNLDRLNYLLNRGAKPTAEDFQAAEASGNSEIANALLRWKKEFEQARARELALQLEHIPSMVFPPRPPAELRNSTLGEQDLRGQSPAPVSMQASTSLNKPTSSPSLRFESSGSGEALTSSNTSSATSASSSLLAP